jgi:hypothetical protein
MCKSDFSVEYENLEKFWESKWELESSLLDQLSHFEHNL